MAASSAIEAHSFYRTHPLAEESHTLWVYLPYLELDGNSEIPTCVLQGRCSASELIQHIKLWLMQGLGHPVLTHSDNVQARFLLQNSEEIVHMHDLITPYVAQMERFELPATCSQSMPSTADLHLDIMRVFFQLSPSCPVDISQPLTKLHNSPMAARIVASILRQTVLLLT